MNSQTLKNAAANSSRTKDISTKELNVHFSTIAENVNRTESNDLCALKEFCDTKHIQSAPPILPMTVTEVYNGTRTFKANWNSWPGCFGWKNTKTFCTCNQ